MYLKRKKHSSGWSVCSAVVLIAVFISGVQSPSKAGRSAVDPVVTIQLVDFIYGALLMLACPQ